MSDVNIIVMSGYVVTQPEVRNLNETLKSIRFRLASYAYSKTNEGFKKTPTYIDVQQISTYADEIAKRFNKSDRVIVHGRLNIQQWVDQSGEQVTRPCIIADKITCLTKAQAQQEQAESQATSVAQNTQQTKKPTAQIVGLSFEEEIPF